MTVPLKFPVNGMQKSEVFAEMEAARKDDVNWRGGRLGLYVHFAGDDVLAVAKEAHQRFFSENALGPSAFPSLKKFETDIVAWTASLLGSDEATGTITSGGTESIFLAMKTARDCARATRPTKGTPIVVAPVSAHPAFDKAAHYLGFKVRRVGLAQNYRADAEAMASAVCKDTIAIIASAPAFPHGVIDPVREIGNIATAHGLWFHVDACVGGFIAPFARRIGYPIPDFDFTIPAVTSISADQHKYGFTAKGASVLLLRDPAMMQYQVFDFDGWPRGRYRSPTFTGTRPGGPIAAAWAVLRYLGIEGYERLVRSIMKARDELISGIQEIEGLTIVSDPDVAVLEYATDGLDVDSLAEAMEDRGWFITRAAQPPGIHVGMLTMAHVPIVPKYLEDLRDSVRDVRAGRKAARKVTATYGG